MKAFNTGDDAALALVDTDRYPIGALETPEGAAFLKDCQESMAEHGWCNLDGFIRPEAIAALREEAKALLPTAQTLRVRRTIYQGQVEDGLDQDDLLNREYTHVAQQLADDQIPATTRIKQLYHSRLLTDFVRRVQRKEQLYICADDFQALNVVALNPGGRHAWHYDTTECTVTLLIQSAEQGGDFAFLPNSRTGSSEDKAAVRRLLGGDMSHAQTFARGEGAFTLFRGGYSLHGVTEVEGNRPRISAVLTYDEQPDRVISDDINIRIYGPRVEQIIAQRNQGIQP